VRLDISLKVGSWAIQFHTMFLLGISGGSAPVKN
jgi:hypothetical protein